jgi:predicted HAD superfamily Cof-like phosphohydrolase
MIIVIEGVDNSGKSTLAKTLSAVLDIPWMHSGGREKYLGEINLRVHQYLTMQPTDIIYDRHPAVSQAIYGKINPNTPVDINLVEQFYADAPFFIYCAPRGLDTHQQQPEHGDDAEWETKLKYNYDILVAEYDRWALLHANYMYRVGDDITPLVNALQTDFISDIQDFHTRFSLTYSGPPRILPEELGSFRRDFMREEINEHYDAELTQGTELQKLEKQLDALVDLVYVALGTSYLQGFPFQAAWKRVHAANMKKIRATSADQSKRGSTYDVVKPAGWQPPSHIDLIEALRDF